MIKLTAIDIFNYFGYDIAYAIVIASSFFILYGVIGMMFSDRK